MRRLSIRVIEWFFTPAPYWAFWRPGSGWLGGIAASLVVTLVVLWLRGDL